MKEDRQWLGGDQEGGEDEQDCWWVQLRYFSCSLKTKDLTITFTIAQFEVAADLEAAEEYCSRQPKCKNLATLTTKP